jgi:predicted SAM-dependent methyltransferase
VGIDVQRLPGVDVLHDLNVHPWPVEEGSCEEIRAWHIVEHIPACCVTENGTRRPFLEFMDECWRVLKVGGRLDVETPYGSSDGFVHDPTHCNQVDEVTFEHFDPDFRRYVTYSPRPWKIVSLWWTRDGNVNCVLEKRAEREQWA